MLTLDQVQLKSLSRLNGLHPVLAAATVTLIERSYAQPERKKYASERSACSIISKR
jgi:hypothetical protein